MSIKSFLRKFGLVIFTLIFCISLSFLLLGYGLLELTDYNTLQPIMTDLFGKALTTEGNETEMQMSYDALVQQCDVSQTGIIEIPLGEGDSPIEISSVTLECSDVKAASNYQGVVNLFSKNIFDQLYYKEYAGDFLTLWKQSDTDSKPWLLFSNYFHNFLQKNLKYVFILTILTAVLVVLLSAGILNGIKNIGVSCIFIGIPFLFVGVIKRIILSKIPQEPLFVSSFIDKMLAAFANKFLIAFGIGIVLVVIYIIGKKIKK